MECLKYCQEGEHGLPEWYISEQKKAKELFDSKKLVLNDDDCVNMTKEELEMRKAYVRECNYLLRCKLDYWGD